MEIYTIGEPFPGLHITENISGGRIIFTHDSFNVIIGIHNPTPSEIDSLYDEISYGVYLNGVLPFFCIATHDFASAFSMNFLKVNVLYQKDWIDASTKEVWLFIVDCGTHILKAFRCITIPWMTPLRDVLNNQRYFEKSFIDDMIRSLESVIPVKDMLNLCSFRSMAFPL